jgi:guanosine-3',5'-bis(diphosphate) 3'-pyrophosphohydrolase
MSLFIDEAIKMAVRAHASQFDAAGLPYILHALRVGAAGKTELEQVVGFLHDTIEDTPVGVDTIIRTFGLEVADAVKGLTRAWRNGPVGSGFLYFKKPTNTIPNNRETYHEFILRVMENPISRKVKIYDIADNLSRMANITDLTKREMLEARYFKALQILGR